MEQKKNTAVICERYYCSHCGWPVIYASCNDEFTQHKDSRIYEYWQYCSNKGCSMHDGEGVNDSPPDWMVTQ